MGLRYRVIRDPAYAPCSFLLQRRHPNAAWPDYRDHVNPKASEDTVLFDRDWDFPSLASSLGHVVCEHGSDGTVACKTCGKTATEFISEAAAWLEVVARDELEYTDDLAEAQQHPKELRFAAVAEYFEAPWRTAAERRKEDKDLEGPKWARDPESQ